MTLLRASLLCLAALAFACNAPPPAQEPEDSELSTGTSPLEETFAEASRAYQIPDGLLKAMAYVETRIDPKVSKSAFGGWGMMHLVEREDWNSLARASELTGQDRGRLMVDVKANVQGAAALLRALADESFQNYPELDPNDPGSFFHAVSLYPGFTSAPIAAQYAGDVFSALENGFSVENHDGTVVQAPTYTSWRDYAPVAAITQAAKEYPGAYQWKWSPNYSAGRSSYTYIVIHTVQGSYSGCISWFQNPSSNVSAHYVVRSSDGQVTQMVEHKDTAWHASCYNSKSIGIEHEGYVADPGRWYTDAMYSGSAKLTRYIADRHGIPKTRTRIIGHVEIPSACNGNGHYDPGTGWNWTKYMSLVNGTTTSPTTGKLTGVIYSGGSTSNRVSGATVTTAGKTVTTGTDGVYEFILPAGSYTVNVSKSGMSSNSVTRTLTAGSTVWGSMEINPVTATGKIIGFMYKGSDVSNMANRLPGVTVKVGTKTVTSASDGRYDFILAPGTYTVNATHPDYNPTSVTRTVTSNGTVYGSMSMTPVNVAPPPDTTKPELEIAFPLNAAVLEFAEITVKGTVSDNKDAIGSVRLSINGGTEAPVSVTNGQWSQIVKLSPGANTVKVTANDAAGNVDTVTHTATFNSGVAGRIYTFDEASDTESPVAGATVELRHAETGELVGTGTSGDDGAYGVDTTEVNKAFLLVVKREGYMTHAETVGIPDDHRLKLDLPLTAGDNTPGEIGVEFLDPLDGAEINAAEASVYARATGMLLSAASINGITAEIVGFDGFVAVVPLEVGANEIVAEARGVDGEIVTARMTLTRPEAPATEAPAPSTPTQNVAPAKGGCSAFGGLELLGLLALAPLFRRRRG